MSLPNHLEVQWDHFLNSVSDVHTLAEKLYTQSAGRMSAETAYHNAVELIEARVEFETRANACNVREGSAHWADGLVRRLEEAYTW